MIDLEKLIYNHVYNYLMIECFKFCFERTVSNTLFAAPFYFIFLSTIVANFLI